VLTKPPTFKKGFTLIEMTVAIVVGLMVAGISLTLFNSQLASYRILKAQNFLISEAPQVNNTLNRIVSRANFFRMYAGMNDAISSENAVIENGKILALMFQGTDDNSQSFAVINFDEGDSRLDYYQVNSMAELAVASPSWNISNSIKDATFYVENGVLRIKLVGPNDEEIIYSSSTLR
jgi:prepilin-type N-terminal cleavage/methylation domain-containing protein